MSDDKQIAAGEHTYATLVRGETFMLAKTKKKFEKGVPKRVTSDEVEILEQAFDVVNVGGAEEAEFENKPKFKFSNKLVDADEDDGGKPAARVRRRG